MPILRTSIRGTILEVGAYPKATRVKKAAKNQQQYQINGFKYCKFVNVILLAEFLHSVLSTMQRRVFHNFSPEFLLNGLWICLVFLSMNYFSESMNFLLTLCGVVLLIMQKGDFQILGPGT